MRTSTAALTVLFCALLPLHAFADHHLGADGEASTGDEPGVCTVSGWVTWNGNDVGAGEPVTCHTDGGDDMTVYTFMQGNDSRYTCAGIHEGNISITMRDRYIDTCPQNRCNANDSDTCNVQASGTCQSANAVLVAMLPPVLLVPPALRRRRNRASA